MKQTEAGFKKNLTPLLTAIMMQMAPVAIRKRLKMANMVDATVRSERCRMVIFTIYDRHPEHVTL